MAHVKKRVQKGRTTWRACYIGPDGREHSKSFDRKVDAERFLPGTQVAVAKGDWIDPALGRTTVKTWVDQWAPTVMGLRANTVDRDMRLIRRYLLPRFGTAPLAKVTTTAVQSWLAELQTEGRLADSTVRKIGQVAGKMFKAAVSAGLIGRSPVVGVHLPAEVEREMRFLDPVQLIMLAEAIDPHYRPLVLTAAYSGLRWGELAGLKPERVNLVRRQIQVVEQLVEVGPQLSYGAPKTSAGRRTVAIPAFLAAELATRLGDPITTSSGLVFSTPAGDPMRRNIFWSKVWRPAVRDASVSGLRFHDLRHTAVAFAIAQGAHPKAIQTRMGHSSIQVTLDRYGHLFPGLDEAIAEGLDATFAQALTASRRPTDGLAVVPRV